VNTAGEFSGGTDGIVSVTISAAGVHLVSETLRLPPRSHTTLVLEDRWPQMRDNVGMVLLSVGVPSYDTFGHETGIVQCKPAEPNHAVVVLRFAPSGAFTNVPLIH
jgi:hypothetical protein